MIEDKFIFIDQRVAVVEEEEAPRISGLFPTTSLFASLWRAVVEGQIGMVVVASLTMLVVMAV